jgi:hypothetical protein
MNQIPEVPSIDGQFDLLQLSQIDFKKFGSYVFIRDTNFGRTYIQGTSTFRVTLVNGRIPVEKSGGIYLINADPKEPPVMIEDGIFELSRESSTPTYIRRTKNTK